MRHQRFIVKQQGMILLIMVFVVGIGVLLTVFHSINASGIRARQDEETMRSLSTAKEALIAWAVSHRFNPGQMPWPDRNGDLNYDGSADCASTPFQYSFLLGQLPSQPDTSPCLDPNTGLTVYLGLSTYPSLGQAFRDAQGNRLWYAVSRNLVYDAQNGQVPVINPGMINAPYAVTPYLRMGGTQSYPWLQVLDRNGNLVSERVAAVIIAPGEAIGGQSRSGAALPNQFLDSFQIGAANFSNADSALADEDFIMGDDNRNISANDLTFAQPYNFNDKLVYITIDELMAALEKRVGEQVRTSLKTYQDANGYYPFAAKLGATKLYACATNNLAGILPIANPAPVGATCNYNRVGFDITADCGLGGFSEVNSIFFRRTVTNFTADAGACTFSGRNCTCTGAGSCSRGVQIFQCDANANCSYTNAAESGEVRFMGGEFDAATKLGQCTAAITPPGDACQTIAVDVRCAGIGAGSVTRNTCADPVFNAGASQLPAWFTTNRWQDYVYYELTRPTNPAGIMVGNRTTDAMVATAGRPINVAPFATKGFAQVRPSCNVNDYLDSAENVSVNQVYEATSMLKRNNYNDQTFVVAP